MSVAFYPSPPLVSLSPTPFPSSLITWSFHFPHPCRFSFLACPLHIFFFLFFLFPSSSDSPSSSSTRLARIRGTRGKFRKGESEERTKGARNGRRYVHRHIQPPFCVHYGHLQAGRKGPVYARTCERKAFRKSATKGEASTRGESENLRAIAIRARVHCAKFRQKREREREIDNAIENELNAYQRSNFIFPSSGISITHVY